MKVSKIIVGPVMTNCYIAWDDTTMEGFVVDPGDDAGKIISELGSIKIKYIFVTHGHFDHIMALAAVRKHTGATVIVHDADKACLEDQGKCLLNYFMLDTDFTPVKPDIIVYGGETMECAGSVLHIIHTPGHSKGSYCIDSGDRIFTGDTLFEGDCGRCDLPGGSYDEILRSLRALSELPGDRVVYPGHGASTTLKQERRFNRDMLRAMEKRS